MKKTLIVAASALFFASCGGKTTDTVKIDKLEDACGCADAFVVIADDILNTIGDKTEDEMEKDDALKEKIKPKQEKLNKLENKCRKDLEVKFEKMEECNDKVKTVMKKYEEKF